MNAAITKYKKINRLKYQNENALFEWLKEDKKAKGDESARLLAERASRDLGFKITVHNVTRMRHVVSEILSASTPNCNTQS